MPDQTITLGRRAFFATSLAGGFALSVTPVLGQTITTDSAGLVVGEVQIPVDGGMIPGYVARPEGAGPFPTVLVASEIFGVHEYIQDICRRLAKVGYYAIAAELFARYGDVSKIADPMEIVKGILPKMPDARINADLDAAVAFAKASGLADVSRLGMTGFCWGGRVTWEYAYANPALKAAVAWYGQLAGMKNDLKPLDPIDFADRVKVPVLGLYGGKDQGIPLDLIEKMKAALAAANAPSEIVVYPEAGHAFNADYRSTYVKAAALDGWQRMLTWFKAHGVA